MTDGTKSLDAKRQHAKTCIIDGREDPAVAMHTELASFEEGTQPHNEVPQ